MNVFVLDKDPVKAAEYHCDKHVNKMIVEHLQMMSIVAVINDLDPAKRTNGEFYKTKAFRKHPCTIWMGQSFGNWAFAYHLTEALCVEFEKRFGHPHGGKFRGLGSWCDGSFISALAICCTSVGVFDQVILGCSQN